MHAISISEQTAIVENQRARVRDAADGSIFLMGPSTSFHVSHANTNARQTNPPRMTRLGTSSSMRFARDSSGQCHKYTG